MTGYRLPSGPVLGIDPGGKSTGLVVRDRSALLASAVVERAGDETGTRGVQVGPAYVAEVLAVVAELVAEHAPTVVGVESVVRPNPHVNRRNGSSVIDVGPLLGASIVFGALAGAYPAAVWVPPGSNGSGPLAAYPSALVSAAEARHGVFRSGGGSKLRHARSAWDVAGRAALIAARPA